MLSTNTRPNTNLMTSAQRQLRSNIRNGYFCESQETIMTEIHNRQRDGDYFAVSVLLELLLDYSEDF